MLFERLGKCAFSRVSVSCAFQIPLRHRNMHEYRQMTGSEWALERTATRLFVLLHIDDVPCARFQCYCAILFRKIHLILQDYDGNGKTNYDILSSELVHNHAFLIRLWTHASFSFFGFQEASYGNQAGDYRRGKHLLP